MENKENSSFENLLKFIPVKEVKDLLNSELTKKYNLLDFNFLSAIDIFKFEDEYRYIRISCTDSNKNDKLIEICNDINFLYEKKVIVELSTPIVEFELKIDSLKNEKFFLLFAFVKSKLTNEELNNILKANKLL